MKYKTGSLVNIFVVFSLVLTLFVAGTPVDQATAQGTQPPDRPDPAAFLTGSQDGLPLDIALEYIQANKDDLGLTAADLSDFIVTDQYTSKHTGVTHIYLRQRYQGIEVSSANININVTRNGSIINMGNSFVPNLSASVNRTSPVTGRSHALQSAARSLGLEMKSQPSIIETWDGPARQAVFGPGTISLSPIPVKLVYHVVAPGVVRLAWNLQIEEPSGEHYWSMDVDAENDLVLGQVDFISRDAWGKPASTGDELPVTASIASAGDASQVAGSRSFGLDAGISPSPGARPSAPYQPIYRVFDIPTENPLAGNRNLVSSEDPVASPFGWHDTNGSWGPEFTITRGNNVHAYLDRDNDNTFDPGEAPDGGPSLLFDFPLDLSQEPEVYTASAVTNLFYWNNVLHDVLYHYGFDEVSGNFQDNNYGAGGQEYDYVIAHAQDSANMDNGSFFTPPDGSSALMEINLWRDPPIVALTVTLPISISANYATVPADFGPKKYAVTAMTKSTTPADGCSAITNDVTGKIALIDRGNCSFAAKVLNAQAAGAAGVLIVNNAPGPLPFSRLSCTGDCSAVVIGSAMVSYENGAVFRSPGNQPVTIRMVRDSEPDRDGSFDNGLVAHEYGHGLSKRLVGGPANTSCLGNDEQPGEGWSDFIGLVMTAKDATTRKRSMFNYGLYLPVNGPGDRPTPYSPDMGINPTTYGDIGSLAIPHGVGYAFASMLWEVYWNLVDRHGFNPDIYGSWDTGGNNLAMQLVVDSMKLAPCSPGFVDARNAIISADVVLTGGENYCEIWDGFAKRGLGFSAQQGSPLDRTDGVEAFDLPASCAQPVAQVSPLSLESAQPTNFIANKTLIIKNANITSSPNIQSSSIETVPQDTGETLVVTGTVYQDTSDDPSTASFVILLDIEEVTFLDIFPSNLSDPNADVDLYVYGPGNNLLSSSATDGNDEYISLVFPADGTYTVTVHGYYVPIEPVDFDLVFLALGTDNGSPVGYFEKAITVTDAMLLNIDTSGLANGLDIDLYLLGPSNQLVGSSTSATGVEHIAVAWPPNGSYKIIVRGYDLPAAATFELSIQQIKQVGRYLKWSISEAPSDCSSPGDIAWVRVDPASGSSAPGMAASPKVQFDSSGLAFGTYTAKLCITNAAPATPVTIEVPLTLTTLPAIYLPLVRK